MKTSFFYSKKVAIVLALSIPLMFSGCDDSGGDPSVPGTIRFVGGAAVPENEKVDLKIDVSGNGFLRGHVGRRREDGSYTPTGTTCVTSFEDNTNVVGSVDVYGVEVNDEGELTVPFVPSDGYFRAETETNCIFRPGMDDAVAYADRPSAQVSAQLIPTAQICATFCQARATADCEGQDASCFEPARQSCVSDCATPGALIVSSQSAAIDWESTIPEPTSSPNPGDPIMPDTDGDTSNSQVNIVLDQLQMPTETMIGTSAGDTVTGTCLTAVENRVEEQPCDPTIPSQRFVIETVGRYAEESHRGEPTWISGKPRQRIRRGHRCLNHAVERFSFNDNGNRHTDLVIADCSSSETQLFFFGRTEEERFSAVSSQEESLFSLWGAELAEVRSDLSRWDTQLTHKTYEGNAPGLIRLFTPESPAPYDPTRVAPTDAIRRLKAGESVVVQMEGPYTYGDGDRLIQRRIFTAPGTAVESSAGSALFSCVSRSSFPIDCSELFYDWEVRLVEEQADGSAVVEFASTFNGLCMPRHFINDPAISALVECGTPEAQMLMVPVSPGSLRFNLKRSDSTDDLCLGDSRTSACDNDPLNFDSRTHWTFLRP